MMRWFYTLRLRFRSLFRKSHVEQELSDELSFHLEKLIEEKVAIGMRPEQARYAALRELGLQSGEVVGQTLFDFFQTDATGSSRARTARSRGSASCRPRTCSR